jgi:hypothetical protein
LSIAIGIGKLKQIVYDGRMVCRTKDVIEEALKHAGKLIRTRAKGWRQEMVIENGITGGKDCITNFDIVAILMKNLSITKCKMHPALLKNP